MWNLIIGVVFIVGGLTKKLALLGTDSGMALAGVGAVMVVWGIWQMGSRRRNVKESMHDLDDF